MNRLTTSNQQNAVVRRAVPADFETVWKLLQEYYSAVEVEIRDNESTALRYITESSGGVWLAWIDTKAVGCVILRPLSAKTGEIKRLYVQPAFRRLGLAALLLTALEEHARQIGLRALYLDSKDDLTEAIAFYHRSGYRVCPRYNANPQATVFMTKDLFGRC